MRDDMGRTERCKCESEDSWEQQRLAGCKEYSCADNADNNMKLPLLSNKTCRDRAQTFLVRASRQEASKALKAVAIGLHQKLLYIPVMWGCAGDRSHNTMLQCSRKWQSMR